MYSPSSAALSCTGGEVGYLYGPVLKGSVLVEIAQDHNAVVVREGEHTGAHIFTLDVIALGDARVSTIHDIIVHNPISSTAIAVADMEKARHRANVKAKTRYVSLRFDFLLFK